MTVPCTFRDGIMLLSLRFSQTPLSFNHVDEKRFRTMLLLIEESLIDLLCGIKIW